MTGIMGRVVGLQHFRAGPGVFTHLDEEDWDLQEMLTGQRITGTSLAKPAQLLALWTYILDTCSGPASSSSKATTVDLLEMTDGRAPCDVMTSQQC